MSYRSFNDNVVTLSNSAVNGKTIGNYSLGFTDPNMRFLPMYVITESLVVTGAVSASPTFSSGVTSASYVDIAAATSSSNVITVNGISRQSLLANNLLTIAPNTQVFCRISVAATGGTVLTLRYSLIGVYY